MDYSLKKLLAAGGLALAVTGVVTFGSTSTAEAITCVGNNTTEYNLVVSNTSACGLSNNDSESALGAIPGVFEAPPAWTLSDKSDDNAAGDPITLSGFVTQAQGGNWSISAFPELTQLAIVLKAGQTWAAFLLEPFITSGTWTTDRNLSHASLYYRTCEAGDPGCGVRDEPPTSPIPLPAAGWLLLGGLGALAAVRRRKKAA